MDRTVLLATTCAEAPRTVIVHGKSASHRHRLHVLPDSMVQAMRNGWNDAYRSGDNKTRV
eukprot:671382-Pleurochrysis_carterae.AAC.1